ncbi:hypothetical protein BAY61_13040 [Prauserella marina]|nr:hypothetical protein BAY61_13040 [Prauserella marina]
MAMSTFSRPSGVERLFRRIHPGDTPLARGWDRLEGWLLMLVILVSVTALPFASAVGSETYADESPAVTAQARQRHQVEAVLVDNAPPVRPPVYGGASNNVTSVRAEWVLSDGTRRTGTIQAEAGSRAGSTVPIWIDARGDVVRAPLTSGEVLWNAIAVTLSLWSGIVIACAGGFWLTRKALDRRRFAEWEREWADIDPRRSR